MSTRKVQFVKGSDNVFKDLGFADSEERLAKAKLAARINAVLEKRGYRQKEAAEVLGINQPKISALANGNLSGFSMERLIHFLNLLNQDVEIVIKPRRTKQNSCGHLRVAIA